MNWDWRHTALAEIARSIRRASSERRGAPIYVYVRRGQVVALFEFVADDDYVGCFTASAHDNDIVRFLIDAVRVEA